MHKSALEFGKSFFDVYAAGMPDGLVIDIGAQDVNGSLKDLCPEHLQYCGVDFVEAKGVDVVLTDPYQLPFEDNSVDIVVCSSCFEHSELFWLLFLEILRILKPSGLFYLNAPSNGYIHRYPVDCWRLYPDAGRALVTWGQRSGFDPVLLESFIGDMAGSTQSGEGWNDFIAVFLKSADQLSLYSTRITDELKSFSNGLRAGSDVFVQAHERSQDQRVIESLGMRLHEEQVSLRQVQESALKEAQDRQREFDELAKRHAVLREQAESLHAELTAMRATFSWRITSSLRTLRGKFGPGARP